MPVLDVAHEQPGELVGTVDRTARAVQLEVQRQRRSRVPAGGRDELDRRPAADRRDGADIAAEAGHGQVHDRPDPEVVEGLELAHVPARRRGFSSHSGPGEVALELRVTHEDVLVHQRDAEVRPASSGPEIGLDRASPMLVPGAPTGVAPARVGRASRLPPACGRPRCPRPATGRVAGHGRASGQLRHDARHQQRLRSSRSSITATIMSRAWNWGSATMSAMLLIRLTGIAATREGCGRPRPPSASPSTPAIASSSSPARRTRPWLLQEVGVVGDSRPGRSPGTGCRNSGVVLAAMQTRSPSAHG